MAAVGSTRKKALVSLLESLFTPDELRRFLDLEMGAEDVVQAVSFLGSPGSVCYEVVQALERLGHITPALFEYLRRKRPRRADDVSAVEAAWFGAVSRVPGQTHVITLVGTISGNVSSIDDAQIREALGDCTPLEVLPIDLHSLDVEREPRAWVEGRARIFEMVQEFLREKVARSAVRHVSVFGLAPIPWLMALGYALSETVPSRLFTRLRVPSTWCWQPDEPGVSRWSVRSIVVPSEVREVAVLVSASARVSVERVDAALPPEGRATYEITLAEPRIDAVRSEAQLDAFGGAYRSVLDRIEREHPGVTRVHLFGAMPVAVAIDCGRRILHSADPTIVTYQLVSGRYVPAIELAR